MKNDSPLWNTLKAHRAKLESFSLKSAFASDPDRAQSMTHSACGLVLDYSKNRINEQTLDYFCDLHRQNQLSEKIDDLISGANVNNTENRPALHTALRSPSHGSNAHQQAIAALDIQMSVFIDALTAGKFKGFSGKNITDIVNIGIGGSDLGPHLVTEALTPYHLNQFHSHFVSNMDASHIWNTLSRLNPETTLFIISSKSFSTLETLTNAKTAIDWLISHGCKRDAAWSQCIAITSMIDKAKAFGVLETNIFPMWDWVGGRYSLWSAIGLPIAIAIGMDNFRLLKAGAQQMDEHFTTAPFEENMPVILASLGLWYYHFWNASSLAVLPYSHDLRLLPSFLQQLEMESNGKGVDINGNPTALPTCPVIWGEAGTTGQHSFHQLLHQGSHCIPVDFILPLRSHHGNNTLNDEHQKQLAASCLSQSQALMNGITVEEVQAALKTQQLNDDQVQALTPHKVIPGNRPSNTITMEKLTPKTLGALIALYEHKVFVQSVFWDINAFDQWGVELGKVLGHQVAKELESNNAPSQTLDSSTRQLIEQFKAAQKDC